MTGNFALRFQLNVFSISVHISGSIRLSDHPDLGIIGKIFSFWVVGHGWCQFLSRLVTSEVEERPRFVRAVYNPHRSQRVKDESLYTISIKKILLPDKLQISSDHLAAVHHLTPLNWVLEHIINIIQQTIECKRTTQRRTKQLGHSVAGSLVEIHVPDYSTCIHSSPDLSIFGSIFTINCSVCVTSIY